MPQSNRYSRAFLHKGSGGVTPRVAPLNGKGRDDQVEHASKAPIFHGWTVSILAFQTRLYQDVFGREDMFICSATYLFHKCKHGVNCCARI